MPRRSSKEAAKTRARIVDAAQQLFAEHGFVAVSTSTISRAAGVTDGALFHHFRSKKELFSEIATRLHTDIHKAIYRAGLDAADPIEGFIVGARKSMEVTQLPQNQRIVFIEGPVVLGTEKWREIDQQLGLRLIEGGLLAIAGAEELPTIYPKTHGDARAGYDQRNHLCLDPQGTPCRSRTMSRPAGPRLAAVGRSGCQSVESRRLRFHYFPRYIFGNNIFNACTLGTSKRSI